MKPHFVINKLPLSHTLPLTTVKRARLSRSSICNILLALDIRDGRRHPPRSNYDWLKNIQGIYLNIHDDQECTDSKIPYKTPEKVFQYPY